MPRQRTRATVIPLPTAARPHAAARAPLELDPEAVCALASRARTLLDVFTEKFESTPTDDLRAGTRCRDDLEHLLDAARDAARQAEQADEELAACLLHRAQT